MAEQCLRIDLAWMIRNRWAVPGSHVRSTLHWTCGGEPSGSISYEAIMCEPGQERLILEYNRGSGANKESVRQEVRLVATQPRYGGNRWWMICPYRGGRCAKLFKPPNGDRFASRKAWKIGYQSQRVAARDRPFERLFAIQRRLGCTEGWEQPIERPKGMWKRTYDRLRQRYWELDAECGAIMAGVISSLRQSMR